jgi:hypothetical protein
VDLNIKWKTFNPEIIDLGSLKTKNLKMGMTDDGSSEGF